MGRNAGTLPSAIQMSQWWTPARRLREECLVPPTCTCSCDPGPLELREELGSAGRSPEPSQVSSPRPWRGGWHLSVCSLSPYSEVRNGNRHNLVSWRVAELKEQLRALFQQWPDDRLKKKNPKWCRELLNLSSLFKLNERVETGRYSPPWHQLS